MSFTNKQKIEEDFLLEEYKRCWEYIQFHYQQRDRTVQFYYTLVVGAGSFVVALNQFTNAQKTLMLSPSIFLVLLIPLFLVGIFTLGQITSLRKGTTQYHKTIVTIRAQMLQKYISPLWTNDDYPKFYNKGGFNAFTVGIPIIINSFLFAGCIYILTNELIHDSVWIAITVLLGSIVAAFLQFRWYRNSLIEADRDYKPLFPREQAQHLGNKQVNK